MLNRILQKTRITMLVFPLSEFQEEVAFEILPKIKLNSVEITAKF